MRVINKFWGINRILLSKVVKSFQYFQVISYEFKVFTYLRLYKRLLTTGKKNYYGYDECKEKHLALKADRNILDDSAHKLKSLTFHGKENRLLFCKAITGRQIIPCLKVSMWRKRIDIILSISWQVRMNAAYLYTEWSNNATQNTHQV